MSSEEGAAHLHLGHGSQRVGHHFAIGIVPLSSARPKISGKVEGERGMEHEEVETAVHEMAQFAATTGRVLENHKGVLQRHEEILAAQFKAGSSHHDAIQTLRTEVQTLGQQISTLQHSVIKILQAMGLPTPEDLPPGKIN